MLHQRDKDILLRTKVKWVRISSASKPIVIQQVGLRLGYQLKLSK